MHRPDVLPPGRHRSLQGLPFSDWKGSSSYAPSGGECRHTGGGGGNVSLSLIGENHRIPE